MKTKLTFALAAVSAMLMSCGGNVPGNGQQSQQVSTKPAIDTYLNSDTTSGCVVFGGDTLVWIKDMPADVKHGKDIFPNVPDSVLESVGCSNGIPSSMSCFLLKTGGDNILFDAGLGLDNCLLLKTLADFGISPEDLKLVYLTHLHNDHIGTLVKDGKMVFPNAKVYINSVEADAWRSMKEGNDNQLKMLEVCKDNIVMFSAGDTLPGNVVGLDAYGHTPGHTVFQKGRFLLVGDIMHGRTLQIKHPEYNALWDMDPDKAVETRKRYIDYATKNSLIMAGMHFPAAGVLIFEAR